MARKMRKLVERRAVPVDGLEICLRPRHLYEIVPRIIKGAVAADAKIGTGGSDQRFGLRKDQSFGKRRGSACQFRRKIFALVGVEHSESFEEWDRVRLVSIALRPPALLIGHKTVGIDDRGAALALADIAAEAECLAEREPMLRTKAALDHRAPEDDHINSRVLAPGRRVLRQGKRRLRSRSPPRLNPGHVTSPQLCDDLVGDFLIKALPVPTGTSAS